MFFCIVCIVVFFLLLIGVYAITAYTSDKAFFEKIAKEEEERKAIEERLTFSLKTLCTQLGIELTFHDKLGSAAGQILYNKDFAGRLIVNNAKIQILNEYKDKPYVLAHELGHYMAIKSNQDNSEEAVDREVDKLCRAILNDHEQEMLKIGLKCHFHQEEVA